VRPDDLRPVSEALAAAGQATLREALTHDDIAAARRLFVEYAKWLKIDLCFQGFDAELAGLPGAYAPPRGRLLVAGPTGAAFGCIALRPLGAEAGCGTTASGSDSGIGEIKRLYVQPSHRGERWGHRLASALIAQAKVIGYRELKLDTLAWMKAARATYADLGFRPCAAYYHNPLPDVVYMSLDLSTAAP